MQEDGVKWTNDFHVVSVLECGILLGVNANQDLLCSLEEGSKIKKFTKKENAESETTEYCKYVKELRINEGDFIWVTIERR